MSTSSVRVTPSGWLRNLDDQALRHNVITNAKHWSTAISRVNKRFRDTPKWFTPSNVAEITDCRDQSEAVYGRIATLVRTDRDNRDYDELGSAMEQFQRLIQQLHKVLGQPGGDQPVQTAQSVATNVTNSTPTQATANPTVAQPTVLSSTAAADKPSTSPRIAHKRHAVSRTAFGPALAWLDQLSDTKSPSADPTWNGKQPIRAFRARTTPLPKKELS